MKKNKLLFVLLLLFSITVVSSVSTFFYVKLNNDGANGSVASDSQSGQMLIMTSCNPVYIATLNVVGDTDGVIVENLSQPTTGCLHDYTLTTEDMKKLSKADVLVVNGGGMEGYLEDVIAAYPDLPIIDTYEYVEAMGLVPEHDDADNEEEEHDDADHEEEEHDDADHEEGEHHHEHEGNSHIWMDSNIYSYQVEAIAEGLTAIDSDNESVYTSNANDYMAAIANNVDKLGLDVNLAGANVAILHEAFEYTANSLGANVVATMDLDEERQVSAGEVSEFIDAINDNDVKIVFAEYDYGHSMGQLIEEQTEAKVVYLETLVHGDYSADSYIGIINNNYKAILEKL